MATHALTDRSPRRSLIGAVLSAAQRRSAARSRGPSRLAAAVQQHALTFAGMAAVVTGMWHLGTVEGWVSLGAAVLLADFKIQG